MRSRTTRIAIVTAALVAAAAVGAGGGATTFAALDSDEGSTTARGTHVKTCPKLVTRSGSMDPAPSTRPRTRFWIS